MKEKEGVIGGRPRVDRVEGAGSRKGVRMSEARRQGGRAKEGLERPVREGCRDGMGRGWKRKMERVELRGWVDRVAVAGGEKKGR